MGLELIEDHTVHTRFLDQHSFIIDLGANRGLFSKAMISRFNCQCIAVEPTPELFDKLEANDHLRKYNFAITSVTQPVSFNVSDIPVSSSVVYKTNAHQNTITVQGKRLDEFIEELGCPKIDLLKMDIEGCEIEALKSCSDELLKSIGQITVEFHDHINVVSKSEIQKLIKRLESLGFTHVSMYLGCYYDTWLINRSLCPISDGEYLYIRHILRNWRGLKRKIKRLFKKK